MTLTIQLPEELERTLRQEIGDLDRAAKEAFLVDLYRRDQITRYELAQSLGMDRFETDAVLKEHNVTEDLPTAEELADDLKRISRLVGK